MPKGSLNKQTASLTQQVGAELLLDSGAHTEEDLLTPLLVDEIGQTGYRLALTNPKYFRPT